MKVVPIRRQSADERQYLKERERIMAALIALAEELENGPKTYLHSKEASDRTFALMDLANKYMSPTRPKEFTP